jgi:hypothetical protein
MRFLVYLAVAAALGLSFAYGSPGLPPAAQEPNWRAPVGTTVNWDGATWTRTEKVDAVNIAVIHAGREYLHHSLNYNREGYVLLGYRVLLERLTPADDWGVYRCVIAVEFNAPPDTLRHEEVHCYGWVHEAADDE